MRKLPCIYENQVDNALYKTIPMSTDFLYDIGFTPNGVTTLSMICGIASIYYFVCKNYYLSSFYFFLFYWFDCVDGFMARRYDMVTDFGDMYDHFKDILVMSIIIYHIISTKMNSLSLKIFIIVIIVIMIISSGYQISCQETYIKSHNIFGETMSSTLDDINFCPAKSEHDAKKHLINSRYLGCGTSTLTMCLIIIFVGIAERNNF